MLKPKFEEFEMTREELIEHYWKMNKLIFEESGTMCCDWNSLSKRSVLNHVGYGAISVEVQL